MRVFSVVLAMGLALPLGALADSVRVDRLFEVTRLTEVLRIMQTEGVAYADTLEADLFPDKGGATWEAEVLRIHNPDRSEAEMRAVFNTRLSDSAIDPVLDFYQTPLGQRIVNGEIAAREAMLDDDVDAAATEAGLQLVEEGGARFDLLRAFIEVNDLIDSNVVGGLNSNFAFYKGLAEGGAFPDPIPETEMLAEVWQQEPELRGDTEEWLFAYLQLAYAGLSDAELEQYIAVSDSEAGKLFNASLFSAFDVTFNRISTELGLAAARYIAAEDA